VDREFLLHSTSAICINVDNQADDELLSQLQAAAAFMERVRHEYLAGKQTLRGRPGITPGHRLAIAETANSGHLVSAVKDALGAGPPLTKLSERFEEMCRRQQVVIDPSMRPAVQSLLATELWANELVLNFPSDPRRILRRVQRDVAALQKDEKFALFSDKPGVLRSAALSQRPQRFPSKSLNAENSSAAQA
jgi:hypothetical protein